MCKSNQKRSETTRALQLLQQTLNIASISFCGLVVQFLCILLVNVVVFTLCEWNFAWQPGSIIHLLESEAKYVIPSTSTTMFLLCPSFCSLNYLFPSYFRCLLEQLKTPFVSSHFGLVGPHELKPLSKTMTRPRKTTAPQWSLYVVLWISWMSYRCVAANQNLQYLIFLGFGVRGFLCCWSISAGTGGCSECVNHGRSQTFLTSKRWDLNLIWNDHRLQESKLIIVMSSQLAGNTLMIHWW